MIHKSFPVGMLQCNCSIVCCERTKQGILVDPGDEAERILAELKGMGVVIKYILHTHAHFDHIGATSAVRKNVEGLICLHPGDEWLYQNVPMQGKAFGMRLDAPTPVEKFLKDGETLTFGDHEVEVLHTPGHTPGSVCFQVSGAKKLVFSGDTLFRQGIGRTDLWGGSYSDIIKSIKERLFTLDGETEVIPGHGPKTAISTERESNPFFAGC